MKSVTITSLENPKFVKPIRIKYVQNNQKLSWEAVRSYDSVAILLYHKSKDSFVLVKQFRPPVYVCDNNHEFTYELCAGIIDKESSLEQIAKEEIDEECGYDVPLEKIEKITSFFTNVGVSGAKQHLFFTIIDENMKVHEGGGIHTESIELVYLNVSEAKKFVFDESKAKTPGLMFAFYWFFDRFRK
jgi:UDP-sugar diphosphatase